MVLLDMFGKIEPTLISKKLGIGLCNPSSDWISGFQDDFEKEILVFNHDIATYQKHGHDTTWASGRYDLASLIDHYNLAENGKTPMQIVAEHLVEIQVSDFENSMLQMKNDHLDSPSCEPQYARKFLNFCCKVQSAPSAHHVIPNQVPFSIYDSDELFVVPRILNFVCASLRDDNENRTIPSPYTSGGIQSLKHLGQLIDSFLLEAKDFWLLDYIINALFFDNDSIDNAHHIFKTMSLIEMLIINPNKHGKTQGEMERKLPQFLPDRIPEEKRELFSEIMRKMRNKIGHGDFSAVQALLEQYRESFMQNFWYDEFENSIETWTYGNICLNLDEALNEILWLMLSDRAQLIALQNS